MYPKQQTQQARTTNQVPILIAARPSRMRNSLSFLLGTMPGIQVVGCADDSSCVLSMVSDLRPALVLLDTNLPGENTAAVLHRLQDAVGPGQPRLLVLVDTQRQQQHLLSVGADVALLKGYPTTRLFEQIETLTARRPQVPTQEGR